MEDVNSKNAGASRKDDYCIWMNAGLVAYKLCDREYRCEECPLDDLMRKESALKDQPPLYSLHAMHEGMEKEHLNTPKEHFERSLEDFFQPLLSVQLPTDRLYTKCHMWVHDDTSSATTIGVDHIGAYFLQPIVSVVLPQTPSRIEYKSPCTWLVLREGTIALRSAVAGIATDSNNNLLEHPYLLLDDPYKSGWLLRIKKSDGKQPRSDLLTADDFTPIFHEEVRGVRDKFAAAFRKLQPNVGPTHFDGGEPVKSVQEILGQKKYFEIICKLFSKR
jgi:glycine cleavage system H protein